MICRLFLSWLSKILVIVFLLVTVTAISFCQADPLEKKVLVVAGDEHFPPYEFVDDINGSKIYRGFNVDIIKSIALYTGYEIQFRPMPWAEALDALDRGEVDAISGMKYDQEREKIYDFSEEYIVSSEAIFVLKEMSAISESGDLVGKKVAVQRDDIAYDLLKNKSIELSLTINQEEAIQLLLDHKVDAVVGNKLTGQYILQKSKSMDRVKLVGGTMEPQRYCIAVKKGNSILSVFNKGLKEIKSNGTYDKIYANWFGEPVDYPAQYYKKKLLLALGGGVFLLVIAIITVYINLILKREVRKRTQEIQNVNNELLEKNEYIKQSDKYKEKMLNSDYSGLITINKDGKIQFANAYAQKYLSVQEQPIIDQNYQETNLRDLLKDQNLADIKVAKNTFEFSLGKICIEYNVDVLAVNNEDNELIIHFRDITEEKRLSEEVIKKDKMEALGNLVACIAHEIRTPLTSIKTFTELIPIKYDNPLFRDKISEFVPQEIERLNGIINDLLTYANPPAISREVISLKSLVDSILVFFSDLISKRGIDLKVNIDDKDIVLVDKQQMKQVMINVMLNAIQALEERQKPYLYIDSWRKDGYSFLRVNDNGTGIAEENMDKIFDPFFTTKASGTGLGLFVSYQLAKQNEVQFHIASEENIGTSVILQFSVQQEEVMD